jgi:uncharacterized protein YcfJ
MHMTMRLSLACAAVLAAAPLAAQESSSARLEALRLFRAGETLRLHVHRVGTLRGTLLQLDTVTLLLRDRRAQRNIPVVEIDSIWRRENHRTKGTAVGLVTGGLVGALVGTFLGPTTCGCANPPTGRYAVRGVVMGMSLGAVIGTVAGGVVTRWERWYP